MANAQLELLDAYWRAANYLSVGQIYLLDNPLIRKPLQPEHVKPRLLGHFGTVPGLNLVYAHLNRAIRARDLDAIFVTGPGHGGPANVANAYLEGTYSELYPNVGGGEEGLRVGKAAVAVHADRLRPGAQVLATGDAGAALSAAEPGIDDALVAELHVLRIGAERDHGARDLVAHRARQRHALAHVQALAVAEVVVAVVQVQVGVAHTAVADLQQHFAALRRGCVAQRLGQRFAEGLDRVADHGVAISMADWFTFAQTPRNDASCWLCRSWADSPASTTWPFCTTSARSDCASTLR